MQHAWQKRKKCTRLLWQSPKDRDNSEDRGVDGRMGTEWILRRLVGVVCGMDPVGSGQRPVAGSCEYSDETSVSGATELV
jgi:hypothetical protein